MHKYFPLFFSIIAILTTISCNKDLEIPNDNPPNTERIIVPVNNYTIAINEPSGLSFDANGNLFCVDDNSNQIYNITKEGVVLSTLPYIGDDLESVSYNPKNNRIYTTHEGERKLIELDYQGTKLNEWQFTVSGGSSNKGFEGLAIDSDNEIFYILNEASPGLLIVWDYKTKSTIEQISLNIAKDYSGIFYDKRDSTLWIISDKSQKLFNTNLRGEIIDSFDLDYDKAEGIVVDIANNLIYIVRDFQTTIKLYVYKISTKSI